MNSSGNQIAHFITLHKKTVGVIFPIPLILICFWIVYKKPLYLISDQENALTSLSELSDRADGGNSSLAVYKNSSRQIVFKYTLDENTTYPYAKIRFSLLDESFFNLSKYDYAKIKIRASKGIRIPFYLSAYEPGHTNPELEKSYRYLLNNLNVNTEYSEFVVPFGELNTPDWWYISNRKVESDFSAPDFSKIKYLYFANCINIKKNIEDTIDIRTLSFHVSLFPFFLYSFIFLACYYSLFGFFITRKKKELPTKILFEYEKVVSQNHQDKEEETIFKFLESHYVQPELTITDVQNATGIHERKISGLVKNKTGLNFKQYLNTLRITEAKKLLSDSSLPISEIAFKSGYGNASHFNRVFKNFEGCSPNDYRKERQ